MTLNATIGKSRAYFSYKNIWIKLHTAPLMLHDKLSILALIIVLNILIWVPLAYIS